MNTRSNENRLSRFVFQTVIFLAFVVIVVVLRQMLLPTVAKFTISPFFALWDPRFTPYIIITPFVSLLFVISLRYYFRFPTWSKLVYLFVGFFVLTIAVNIIDAKGTLIFTRSLVEYVRDARTLYESGNFLIGYHEKVKSMEWHTSVHPPGIFLYLYPLIKLFGEHWLQITLVNAFIGGFGVIFTWLTTKSLYNERSADFVGILFLTAPALLFYGGSFDTIYMVIGTLILYLITLYVITGRTVYPILLGPLLAIGMLFTYQIVYFFGVLGFFMLMLICIRLRNSKSKIRSSEIEGVALSALSPNLSISNIVLSAFLLLTGFTIFYLLLFFIWDYDVITTFVHQQKYSERYFSSGANLIYLVKVHLLGSEPYTGGHRSYLLWMPGNLIAFFTMFGIPTAIVLGRRFFRSFKAGWAETQNLYVIVIGIGFIIYNVIGLTLGEAERVWLYIIPGFLICTAPYLIPNRHLLYTIVIFNLSFAWIYEIFFQHVN